jgi:hypothetical protein
MTKAYSQPLVSILAIAQNLNEVSSMRMSDAMQRLTDPALGRTEIMTAVTAKLKSAAVPEKFWTDEERDVKHDFETLRQSPGAVDLLKKILAERHRH